MADERRIFFLICVYLCHLRFQSERLAAKGPMKQKLRTQITQMNADILLSLRPSVPCAIPNPSANPRTPMNWKLEPQITQVNVGYSFLSASICAICGSNPSVWPRRGQ